VTAVTQSEALENSDIQTGTDIVINSVQDSRHGASVSIAIG